MKTLKEFLNEEPEQLNEFIITGLIGYLLGFLIADATGILGVSYDYDKSLLQNIKDARFLGSKEILSKIKKLASSAKIALQVRKLEKDPDVQDIVKNNMSGRSFKNGKKDESIKILKSKLKNSEYSEIRDLLDVVVKNNLSKQ